MPEQKIISSFKISALLALDLRAELNAEEQGFLDNWLKQSPANQSIYNRLKDDKIKQQDLAVLQSFNMPEALRKVQDRINTNLKNSKNYRPLFYAIAAAVALMTVATFFYLSSRNSDLLDSAIVKNITITTSKGMDKDITLPDGTKVWLNAVSTLSYSPGFDKSDYRTVSLIGEAYFVVTKNPKRPFIVKTKLQNIEVVGTEFLVESYPEDSEVKTSLYNGIVKVKRANKPDIVLSPGQQSLVSNFAIRIKQIENVNENINGQKNDISFDKEPLDQVMRKIARWYDIEVSYPENVNAGNISGSISKNASLAELREILAALYPNLTVAARKNQIIITEKPITRK
ncbi:FecR family protein [Pedobacter sp. PWIIR3]